MKYKINDRFICKRNSSGNDQSPDLKEGKTYIIESINYIGCGYYLISGYLYYAQEDMTEYRKQIWENMKPNLQGSVGMQGVSPSFKIEDYFYSIKEERRKKLDKINEKM